MIRAMRSRWGSHSATICWFGCLVFICAWGVAQTSPDELRVRLEGTEGEKRLIVLNQLAQAVAATSPTDSLVLSEQAITLAGELNHHEGEADALNNLGIARYYLADYDQALEHYETSLALARSIGYDQGIANSLNNLGIIYWIWGEYDRTTEYYLQTLELRRRLGDEPGTAKALNNLGSVSFAADDFEEALEHYSESLAIYRRLGDQSLIASSLNNIGLVHFELGDDDIAEEYFARGLSIAESTDDLIQQAYSLTHLGMVAERRDDHRIALDHHRRALEVRLATGDRRGVAVSEHNIGASLNELGETEAAFEHLQNALVIAEEINLKQIVRDTHLALSLANEQIGDYEKSLEHHRRFKEINDELFNEESDRRMAELQTRFQLVEKDAEIERLRIEQEKQRVIRNAMMAGSIAMLLIVLLLYNRYRLKTRANRVIGERNLALEQARIEQDRAHRAELTHVGRVTTMGELTAAITHELNQPLTAILTNARAGQRFLGAEPPDLGEVNGALDDVVEGAERTRDLIKRLRELIRRGEITREVVDVNDALRGVESIARAETQLAGVTLELSMTPDLPSVFGDRVQIQQVLLNLVQNGAAATVEGSTDDRRLTISTMSDDQGAVVVAVRDHGPPVKEEIIREMFEPFFTTKNEGLGMGLSICRTIIEAHGGELRAEQHSEGGLTMQFSLPIAEQSK